MAGKRPQCGPVAQSVEQRTENPCVDSSILSWPTIEIKGLRNHTLTLFLFGCEFKPASSNVCIFLHLPTLCIPCEDSHRAGGLCKANGKYLRRKI
jgi:hypothetical protein